MLTSVTIKGFRSIREQQVDLAPLTVLYGPTASGKSSLLYALLVLRKVLSNPNEPVDSFFSLGFVHLGGFEECVFNHQKDGGIAVGYTTEDGEYSVTLRKSSGELALTTEGGARLCLEVTFPYALDKQISRVIGYFSVSWNGVTGNATAVEPLHQEAVAMTTRLNRVVEAGRLVDIVPHRRGFFKPYYTPVPLSSLPTTEDELATPMVTDPYLIPKISVDLESITGRDFRLYTPPGSSLAYLQTTDKQARVPCNLANDGFGVNQLVYMLAKVHRSEIQTVLIEEPEVHLYPSVMRRFARRLCRIAVEEGNQFILTTHSEVFVSALLASVARKEVAVDKIRLYLTGKQGKETVFQPQAVKEDGQIQEGMKTFMEGELEDIKALLGI